MPQVDEENNGGIEPGEELFSDFTTALFRRSERRKPSEHQELIKTSDNQQSSMMTNINKNPLMAEEIDATTQPIIFGGLNTEKMKEFNWYFPYNNCENVINYMRSRFAAVRLLTGKTIKKDVGEEEAKKKGESARLLSNSIKSMASGLIHFTNIQKYFHRKKYTIKGKRKNSWRKNLFRAPSQIKK
jgi:hypothetical protein